MRTALDLLQLPPLDGVLGDNLIPSRGLGRLEVGVQEASLHATVLGRLLKDSLQRRRLRSVAVDQEHQRTLRDGTGSGN